MNRALIAAALTLSSLGALAAAPPAALPFDCFKALDLTKARQSPAREVTIAVDETTVFTPALVDALTAKTIKALQPGDRVQLVVFSTTSSKNYLREVLTIELDRPPTEAAARDLPIRRAQDLVQCIGLQRVQKLKLIEAALRSAAQGGSPDIPVSEILGALREIGSRLTASEAPQRLLILASDGLQHSSSFSFYDRKVIRRLNPARELAQVQAKGLVPRLTATHVVFFGGGLATADGGVRDQEDLVALENFWQLLVKAAGGELVAFGKPVPLVDFK